MGKSQVDIHQVGEEDYVMQDNRPNIGKRHDTECLVRDPASSREYRLDRFTPLSETCRRSICFEGSKQVRPVAPKVDGIAKRERGFFCGKVGIGRQLMLVSAPGNDGKGEVLAKKKIKMLLPRRSWKGRKGQPCSADCWLLFAGRQTIEQNPDPFAESQPVRRRSGGRPRCKMGKKNKKKKKERKI